MSNISSHEDDSLATLAEAPTSRRAFLRTASLTAVGGALVACAKDGGQTGTAAAQTAASSTPATTAPAQTGGTMGAHDTAKPAAGALNAADAMDAMHEKGVKAFPAKTAGQGQPAARSPGCEGASRSSSSPHARCSGRPSPGRRVKAWAYNGQVPGRRSACVRATVCGSCSRTSCPSRPRSTSTASSVPIDQDGVPFITQPPGQARRVVHLRVHRAEPGLAHVPLAPQRREAGRAGAARRVHRRAEGPRAVEQGRRRLRDDPERRHRTATP